MRKLFTLLFLLSLLIPAMAKHQPEFSTAGFFAIPDAGRSVYSMNPAWRFHKGVADNAYLVDFDDTKWSVISLPHGIEYLPIEASGCVNYQGEVWYRKHFTPDTSLKGKKLFLHFEAIMGKSKVYVNGHLLNEYFGGFMPVIADITDAVNWDGDNVIAVWADNSNDPAYPPGKAQNVLDFAYFGGIYRDCWLVAHNQVFITDPNYENETASGGLLVAFDRITDQSADVILRSHIRNTSDAQFSGVVEYLLENPKGEFVARQKQKIRIPKGEALQTNNKITVKAPQLWSPETPDLYQLYVRIKDSRGKVIDGYRHRMGIRSYEFKGTDGFWLNGKPYKKPLIGANRHQDYALVGNALPNPIHWRDAKKLRDIGLKVIRNAHYPQDPAFMDACDELGLLVIVNTPGWQFWNPDPIFGQRVYQDVRNMVRRDRNHPSVWMWEPVLNETWYPEDFAQNVFDIVRGEFPYASSYSACDYSARGADIFPIQFTHPQSGEKQWAVQKLDSSKTYFTREWGDNVDDWNSHNSPSRVARGWGEAPMLVQADHYARPSYTYSCYDSFFKTDRQHMGGCLWHSFDHQRGYHPDPFYGGLMDAFRQPKYSYYMFMSQRDTTTVNRIYESGPMIYIAHEMTPFSPKDVTVYSNCDEVRLTVNKDGKPQVYQKESRENGLPSPIVTFANAFNFMTDKNLSMYKNKQHDVFLLAEGLIDGKVVATHEIRPARRPQKLLLWIDNENNPLVANGSDFITVVAAVADASGNIKRLNDYHIRFTVEGEGRILGDASVLANPAPVRWGTAPMLLQSTIRAGKIKVQASVWFEGSQMPVSAELELTTVPSTQTLLYNEKEASLREKVVPTTNISVGTSRENQAEKAQNAERLKEVERQQKEFGEGQK